MATLSFSPYDYALHDDPYPLYARLRTQAPLYRNEELDFWALSRHADVVAAFRDPARFSSANGVSLDPSAWGPYAHKTMSFLALDPPRHTRMRALVAKGFTPRRVAELEQRIRELSRRHLSTVLGGREFDFVTDFALRFPTAVFLQIMGLPLDHLDMLLDWETRILHPAHEQEAVNRDETLGAQVAVTQYFTGVIEERRRMRAAERPEGLVTDALDWRIDGEPVSDEELLRFYLLMFMAGLDTVTAELGYGFLHLATHPQDRRRLVEDPEVIPRAVEELLRVYPIVNTPREVSRETEIAGCPVRPGDFVMISYPGAGRDESVYADARTVDFDRTGMSHLTFGAGPHRCLGSHLARHELAVAYEEWHKRIPEYRLAEDVEFTEATGGMMALNALPLRWDRP